MKRYASKPINSGFKLRGEDGTERAVCPKAKCTGVNSPFVFELDHARKFEGSFVGLIDDPLSIFPTVLYDVPDDIHEMTNSKSLRGVSPLITATRIDEQTQRIVEYRLDGISLQVDTEPVCPSSHCPTTFVGGKEMPDDTNNKVVDKVEDKKPPEPAKTTENPVKTEQTATKTGEQNEYIAKLIRENEDLKRNIEKQNKVLKDIEDKRRDELMKLLSEEQTTFAKDLELSALEKVVSIIEKSKAKATTEAARLQEEAEKKKIVTAGAVEISTDQKGNNEGKTPDAAKKDPMAYENFFDRSSVLKKKT